MSNHTKYSEVILLVPYNVPIKMGDIPPSPSSFKNALSYFNKLDRSATSPLIPRSNASNFEVNLKLVIDNKTVTSTAYDFHQESYDVQQFIPRARLIRRQDEAGKNIIRNIPAQDYQKPVSSQISISPIEDSKMFVLKVPPKIPPRIPPRPTSLNLRSKISQSIEETPLINAYQDPKDQMTPDIEAKKILEAFTKEITPYNTFEIPVDADALDSDFLKQTLTLANSEVDLSEVEVRRISNNSKRSSRSPYRLPEKTER